MRARRSAFAAASAWALSVVAFANPWLPPGDESIRHDLQLLADAGLVNVPLSTWPVSWPDVARGLSARSIADLDPALAAALRRVQRRARDASIEGVGAVDIKLAGATDVAPLRGFEDAPRAKGQLSAGTSWLGDHLALNVVATAVADPEDGHELRADGSYVGLNVGNFMIAAGLMDRWWGPGWDGSLILSSNARPIPGITVERNYSDPFRTRWLSWLGPWRASITVGALDGSDVAVPEARFFAARVNIKPQPWLEIGLSRTAQWCGTGRPCGGDTFTDLLIGRDNRSDSLGENEEPGNQMAGYDLRLRSPWQALPLALYAQLIGEDEAGGLPSKFIGQFGAEGWGTVGAATFRVHVEYADTACLFSREVPQYECAYRNALYPQGYTYRGRIIGHALDNDSRMWSLGGILVTGRGDSLNVAARRADLNRNGGPHAIRNSPGTMNDVEFRYSRAFAWGRAGLAMGWSDGGADASETDGMRASLIWQKGF
jgi:hypothetical protein